MSILDSAKFFAVGLAANALFAILNIFIGIGWNEPMIGLAQTPVNGGGVGLEGLLLSILSDFGKFSLAWIAVFGVGLGLVAVIRLASKLLAAF